MCIPVSVMASSVGWLLDHAWSIASAIFAAIAVAQAFRNGQKAHEIGVTAKTIETNTNGTLTTLKETIATLTKQLEAERALRNPGQTPPP